MRAFDPIHVIAHIFKGTRATRTLFVPVLCFVETITRNCARVRLLKTYTLPVILRVSFIGILLRFLPWTRRLSSFFHGLRSNPLQLISLSLSAGSLSTRLRPVPPDLRVGGRHRSAACITGHATGSSGGGSPPADRCHGRFRRADGRGTGGSGGLARVLDLARDGARHRGVRRELG